MRGVWIALSLGGVVACTLIFGGVLTMTYTEWQETGVFNLGRLSQAFPMVVFGCVCG